MGSEESTGSGVDTISKEKVRTKHPKMYRVILLNDDYTSMDFVVMVLETIFKKSPAESVQIMMQVHKRGQGTCGVYPREVAESKVNEVHQKALEYNYPLRCRMEEE